MDDKIKDSVVSALAEYIKAPEFQSQFEQFFLNHALCFTDELEHQLTYMTIYIEFQQMFNSHMKIFLAQQNITEDEFVKHCEKAMKVDPKAEQYVDIVIASMDYDAFYSLMKAMRARASEENQSADAKETAPMTRGKRKCSEGKLSKSQEEVDDIEDDIEEAHEAKDLGENALNMNCKESK